MKHYLTLHVPSSLGATLDAISASLQRTEFCGITLPNGNPRIPYFGRLVNAQIEPDQATLSATLNMSFEWPIPAYSALHSDIEVLVVDRQQPITHATIRRRWEQPAQRDHWKLKPLNEPPHALDYTRRLSEKEYRWLMLGKTPLSMDDKWFIFAEENQVFYHRSWTGEGVFKLNLKQDAEGIYIHQAWAFMHMAGPFSEQNVLQQLLEGTCKDANEVYDM